MSDTKAVEKDAEGGQVDAPKVTLRQKGDDVAVFAHLLGHTPPVRESVLVFHSGLSKRRVRAALGRLRDRGLVMGMEVGAWTWWFPSGKKQAEVGR